jgi:hypothetical protein
MTNETDRELLELAAKAAGIEIMPMKIDNVSKQGDNRFIGYLTKADQWPRGWFNPLTDDGDALRLAVNLGLQIVHYSVTSSGPDRVGAGSPGKMEASHTNPNAATRRAIVRAAAEIGRAMA